MPTPTYVALAKTVLTGTQQTITFSSIPSTYTDLLVLISARITPSTNYGVCRIRPNGSTTNDTVRELYNQDGIAGSSFDTDFNFYAPGATATSNTFCNVEIYIPNYAGSTNKVLSWTQVSENNSTTSYYMAANAGLWSNTAAITSLDIFQTTNFASGSRFDLYGIKNS